MRALRLLFITVFVACFASGAPGQVGPLPIEGITPPPSASASSQDSPISDGVITDPAQVLNPARALEDAADAIPGFDGGLSSALNIVLLLTVLGLAPSIILMTTSFLRIVVVLSLLKQAIGAQNLPPSQVVLGLSLFMTLLVMSPTIDRVYREAILPYNNGEITNQLEMWDKAKQPVRDFMFDQIEATGNWSSLYMIMNYRGVDTSHPEKMTRADVDTITLVPAYMLSELKVAFLMGFRVYLPFLVIDVVIASLLISMSMMMLPPVLISLPFKLLLFVLVDGWTLVVGSLLSSFVREGGAERLSNLVATGSP
ncbi:MAG: flagellar type III secretion system pore protein FliP [Phycisphaeraceae bacterium]|nr:flagellar type III secretion system pore protein FliP [Phycisphaeraceae bacterium]